jgi:hypothetical protein
VTGAVRVPIYALLPIVCAVQKEGAILKSLAVAAISTQDFPWLVITAETQGMLWSIQGDLVICW